MNNVDETKNSATAENDVAKPGLWLSPDGIQPLHPSASDADPAATAQEAVHEVMSKKAAREVAPVAGDVPLKAAKGDDDLMSKPPAASPAKKSG